MRLIKRILILNIVGFLALSCQILKPEEVENKFYTKGELGSIGKFSKSGFLSKDFREVGAIKLLEPIRVKVTNKEQVKERKNEKNDSVGVDLTGGKKIKLELRIVDEVNFIAQLNSIENSQYLKYLKENKESILRTSGTWIFNEVQAEAIKNATSIYLVNSGFSKYSLELHSVEGKNLFYFTDLQLIKSEFMQVCWKKGRRGELRIEALIHKGAKCVGGSEENIEKLEKKDLFMLN